MGDDVNAVYFPQLGHLAVLTDRNMSIEIPAHLEWDLRVSYRRYRLSWYQFTTGDQQYFKTPEMKNMDDHFGDIHTKIIGMFRITAHGWWRDKEIEYADRMAEAVKQVEGTINGAVEAVAELDW
jgi:DNA mismatch repair protein MSH5